MLIKLYRYTEYFLYFCFFLTILPINIIYYQVTNRLNNKLLDLLYYTINLNGCILIKFMQWILTHLEINNINNQYDHIINNYITFYENCNVHSLNYTKSLYLKEFNEHLDKVIELDLNNEVKSGSIAQVYKGKYISTNKEIAIKVVHPNLEYQLIYPIYFIKLLYYLQDNTKFFKKYNMIFNFEEFYRDLKKQLNMKNEFKNMEYFLNIYKDNKYIVIPQPIIASKNILIMEYIQGEIFFSSNFSQHIKEKLATLLSLFSKQNIMFNSYLHGDLHRGNWKIRHYNNEYQIIIYDFGLVLKQNMNDDIVKICKALDQFNIEILLELLYKYTENTGINSEVFINQFKNYLINNSILLENCTDTDILLRNFYNFCTYYNYKLKHIILQMIISVILITSQLKNFIYECLDIPNINNRDDNSMLINKYIFEYNLCKNIESFKEIREYIYSTYLNNNIIYKKNYMDDNLNNIGLLDIQKTVNI